MKTFAKCGFALLGILAMGCGSGEKGGAEAEGGAVLEGSLRIDGSSTVYPISEAVAEEFQKANPKVRVTVGQSGTGGGFKKLLNGEVDVANASRPIRAEEAASAKEKGVDYIELPVAYDGISILVNPKNDWVDHITVAELKKIWEPGSTVRKWSQVRAGWPDTDLKLYGPGADSGTFDYFTQAVNGKEHESRNDFTASEDDNSLATGVAGDVNALGYFGFAYFEANADKLKLVPVVAKEGDAPVSPSVQTIADGSYQPLSRPLFIYITGEAAKRPEVKAYVAFHMKHGGELAEQAGYIPLSEEIYKLAQHRFDTGTVGSIFEGKGSQVGVKLNDLLAAEKKAP